MALLLIPDQNQTVEGREAIQAYLQPLGVWHDQWEASIEFGPEATPETILAAYAPVLEPYMRQHGYRTADVIDVRPDTEGLEALRQKFLREHTHSEDEVRFFVEGQGYFWFNPGGGVPVICACCGAGDLLSVPAGMPHWFDLGPVPRVKAIRIFIDTAGWVPHYTETGTEQRYLETPLPPLA